MKLEVKSPIQSINKSYYKLPINKSNFEKFQNSFTFLVSNILDAEREEPNKFVISDFLKNSFYSPQYQIKPINNIDLAIYNGNSSKDSVGVLIEAKRPTNRSEMLSLDNINCKALQEVILYYLEEKITNNNNEIKNIIITNSYEWFIFDSLQFERIFYRNNYLINQFKKWKQGQFDNNSTDYFYSEIAYNFIDNSDETLTATYLSLKPNSYEISDDFLFTLYKLFSPENLLKKPFANDSNSLNQEFYNELLYILGLEEQTLNGKKIINLLPDKKKQKGSIIENTIEMILEDERLDNFKQKSQFGDTHQEQLFSIALELVITWLNRILFLKLLEGQLLSYHNGDYTYKFLTKKNINDFDELYELFFEVLAVPMNERKDDIISNYSNIPYLNSSLFDKTDLEKNILQINQLKDRYTIPIFPNSVLKDDNGRRISGNKKTLEYLFEFLDAYDFSSEGTEKVQENSKTIINASVLGLIFEKINGYKDGSFFTPSFITMYMAKEAIRNTIINKFNEKYSWNCNSFTDLHNFISARRNASDILEFNSIINSITICDPAVGSGHFLVSALNELIAAKSELGILADSTGKILNIHASVENDELIITDDESNIIAYNPKNSFAQKIQKTIFHEKQTLIENCLFGVDINPKSVQITRLRLWIELLKSAYYRTDTAELETLPNIDINIKSGNSLISRYAIDDSQPIGIKDALTIKKYKEAVTKYKNSTNRTIKKQLLIDIDNYKNTLKGLLTTKSEKHFQLNKLTAEYKQKFESDSLVSIQRNATEIKKYEKEKQKLIQQIDLLQKEIVELEINNIFDNAFEWRFEFPEILNDNGDFLGFDIVIGNPPYIQLQKGHGNLADIYSKMNYQTLDRMGDIYALFYEKGLNLLKSNGFLSFITSNKWMRAGYGEKLRNFFLKFNPFVLIDLGPKVFDSATVDTNILIIKKNFENNFNLKATTIKNDIRDKNSLENELNNNGIIIQKLTKDAWTISGDIEMRIKEKIERIGTPLKDWDIKINYGIKTGFNEAFIIDGKKKDELIAQDPKSAEIIKPILRGRDIKRYKAEFADLWIIFIPWHFPLHKEPSISGNSEKAEKAFQKEYPAIYNHLLKYKEQLSKRNKDETGIRYEWYALQRCANTYYEEFEKEKIVWGNISYDSQFCFVNKGVIVNAPANLITSDSLISIKYLMSQLNSKMFDWQFKRVGIFLGHAYEWKKQYVELVSIPKISPEQQQPFIDLVDIILKKKENNEDTTAEEQAIDQLVYKLYDLTEEEIKVVEGK